MRAIAPKDATTLVLRHRNVVLLLDFDGTLAPIVAHADDARISPTARDALRALTRHMPVAVVSGRALEDVRRRVGVRGVAYSGSHGFEMFVRGAYTCGALKKARIVMRQIRSALEPISAIFDGAYLEVKKFGVALHYRSVTTGRHRAIRRKVAKAVATLMREKIRIIDDNKTFDVGMEGADKGRAVRTLVRELAGKDRVFPVYIGDSLTDEDAFRALTHGLTIRVGNKKGSTGQYYFRTRNDVDAFLRLLERNSHSATGKPSAVL